MNVHRLEHIPKARAGCGGVAYHCVACWRSWMEICVSELYCSHNQSWRGALYAWGEVLCALQRLDVVDFQHSSLLYMPLSQSIHNIQFIVKHFTASLLNTSKDPRSSSTIQTYSIPESNCLLLTIMNWLNQWAPLCCFIFSLASSSTIFLCRRCSLSLLIANQLSLSIRSVSTFQTYYLRRRSTQERHQLSSSSNHLLCIDPTVASPKWNSVGFSCQQHAMKIEGV